MDLLTKKGHRKLAVSFVVFGVTMGIATGLVIAGVLDGGQWVDVAKWVGGSTVVGFGVTNSVEHIAQRNKPNPPATTETSLPV